MLPDIVAHHLGLPERKSKKKRNNEGLSLIAHLHVYRLFWVWWPPDDAGKVLRGLGPFAQYNGTSMYVRLRILWVYHNWHFHPPIIWNSTWDHESWNSSLIRGLARVLTPDFFLAVDWVDFGKMTAEVLRLRFSCLECLRQHYRSILVQSSFFCLLLLVLKWCNYSFGLSFLSESCGKISFTHS